MEHDEAKLPRWVQERLLELRQDNAYLAMSLKNTQAASALTCEPTREWFTLNGPQLGDEQWESYDLYILGRNTPIRVATLYQGDTMIIGRRNSWYLEKVQAHYTGKSDSDVMRKPL